MIKSSIMLSFFLFLLHAAWGQEAATIRNRWSAGAAGTLQTTGTFTESYRLPGLKVLFSGGVGLRAGGEFAYINRSKSQLFQEVAFFGYLDPKVERGAMLSSSIGYRRWFSDFYAEALLGVGYLRTVFSDGREVQDTKGNFHTEKFKLGGFTPSLGIGAGYAFDRWSVYVRYNHLVQIRPGDRGTDVRVHRTLDIGMRCVLQRN